MRRLAVAFAELVTASVVGQLIGFAVLAVVARRVGPTYLGAYGFASNLIGYFGLPLSGVAVLAVRDIARNKSAAPQVSGTVVPILAFYGAVVCAAVYFLAPTLSPTHLDAAMLRILSVSLVITLLTLDWVLQGLQVFGKLATARLLGQSLYGIGAALVVTSGLEGLYRYAWLNIFGLGATLAATWVYVWQSANWPSFRIGLARATRILRQSMPFSVSVVMITIYFSADFVLLGFLSTSRNVGQYVVAYKLPAAFLGLASAWVAVFYPHAATQSRGELRRQVGLSTTLSLVVLIPLCAGSLVLGDPLMTGLFGSKYEPAGTYFKLLMMSVAVGGIDANIGQVLLARGDERYFALGVTAGASINVGLNLLLIPTLGPTGSAIATIAAEIVVLGFMATRFWQRIGKPQLLWSRIIGAVVASAVMSVTLLLVGVTWPVLVRVCFGAGVFLVAALMTGAIRRYDLALVRRATVATR
jgi:O-antigen/teichoic acid export membrane protein